MPSPRVSSPSSARQVSAAPTAGPPQGFTATDAGLVLMALIWGVNFSVVKAGLQAMTPLSFTAVRMVSADLVLFAIAVALRPGAWPARADIVKLLALGVLGNGIYQYLFIAGMARTRAGVAALIVAAGPAWIAIISRLMGRERVPVLGWVGIGLQLAGVACVVGSSHGFEGGDEGLLGAALIACGGVAWGFYSVLLQPLATRTNGIQLSALTLASGAALMALVGIPDLVSLDWAHVSPVGWGALAYSSLAAMVIAYVLFYRGIAVLGPTRTSMYSNLQPIVAIVVAGLALHERPTGWQLLGASLIMAGLLVSRTAKVRPHPEAMEEAA